MSSLGRERLSRRCVLGRALRSGAGLALYGTLPLLESCAGEGPPPGLRVELSRIPVEGRLLVMDGELPVEIIRSEETLQARSLVCTHQGCQVRWDVGAHRYMCPCHDGIFDAQGRPVQGPPQFPLREYPIRREDDYVVVDTRVDVGKP